MGMPGRRPPRLGRRESGGGREAGPALGPARRGAAGAAQSPAPLGGGGRKAGGRQRHARPGSAGGGGGGGARPRPGGELRLPLQAGAHRGRQRGQDLPRTALQNRGLRRAPGQHHRRGLHHEEPGDPGQAGEGERRERPRTPPLRLRGRGSCGSPPGPAPRSSGPARPPRCRRGRPAPARLPEEAAARRGAGGERCRPPGVPRLRAAPAARAPVPLPTRPWARRTGCSAPVPPCQRAPAGQEGPSASVNLFCYGRIRCAAARRAGSSVAPRERWQKPRRQPALQDGLDLPRTVTAAPLFSVRLLATGYLEARSNLSWTVALPERDVELADRERLGSGC